VVKITDAQQICSQLGPNKSLTRLNRLLPVIVADTEVSSYLTDSDRLLTMLHRYLAVQ